MKKKRPSRAEIDDLIEYARSPDNDGLLAEQTCKLCDEIERLRRELTAARSVLSEAVGHEDEPHETLEACARLLVLDCDAEHDRAVQAEDAKQQAERERDTAAASATDAERTVATLHESRSTMREKLT